MPIRSQTNFETCPPAQYDCNEALPFNLLCQQRTYLNFKPLPITFIADVKLGSSADLLL